MNVNYAQRHRAVARQLRARKLDCLVVTQSANWYYLTGFTGESGALVVFPSGSTLITDGRFTVQAQDEARGTPLRLQKGPLYASVGEFLESRRVRRFGFDPGHLTLAEWKALQQTAGAKCRGIEAGGVVERLRSRKDAVELAIMSQAARLAGEVMEAAIQMVRPGIPENQVAAEIDYQLRKRGASQPSFETIVASGWRSALPHARPTSKLMKKNELVVLDLGAILGHYCSDMTRTVHIGTAPKRIREWHHAVNTARAAAIAVVQAGVSCGAVDAAAREVLQQHGFESFFVHSTGHGLGLEVHEEPRVAKGQSGRLQAGNVITIEPGIYVAGTGGIRIEDDVAVLPRGHAVLTRVRRDLIEI